jgi:hypothetical protein
MLVGLLGLMALLLPVLGAQAQTPKEALLRASNAEGGTPLGDTFGLPVEIDGDRAIVGADGEDGPSNGKTDVGAAYVFEWKAASGWQEVKVLRASNAEAGDSFGASVTIDGDQAIVGAYLEDGPSNKKSSAGAVYVFERTEDGWTQNEDKILRASNAELRDRFGTSVAISGDRAIIGARYEDGPSNGKDKAGAAYVFERTEDGWTQNEDKILRASNAEGGDEFGYSVEIDGDRAIVGAFGESGPLNNKSKAGAAYVFERTSSGWNQNEDKILRASNADSGDQFGISVAIDGNRSLVGAIGEEGPSNNIGPDAGAAYVKALPPPTFTAGESTSLTVKENGSADLTSTLAVADKSDSDNLTWRVTGAPSGSLSGVDGESKSISGSNSPHTLSTSPTYAPDGYLDGSDSFVVQVSDGSATDVITVDVTVNGEPSISSLSDRVIRAGQTLGPVSLTVSDPETAAGQLAVSASSGNATLVPESGLTVTEPDASGDASLEVEPAAGETGTATVTVTVEDKNGQTASSSFELQVTSGTVSASVSRSFGDASGPGDYCLVALPGQVNRSIADAVSGEAGQEPTVTTAPTAASSSNTTDRRSLRSSRAPASG